MQGTSVYIFQPFLKAQVIMREELHQISGALEPNAC